MKNEKTTQNRTLQKRSYQRNKRLVSLPRKIRPIFLKIDKGTIQINGLKGKKIVDDARPSDVDRLYRSRKEGGRGLATIEECVDTTFPGQEIRKKHPPKQQKTKKD